MGKCINCGSNFVVRAAGDEQCHDCQVAELKARVATLERALSPPGGASSDLLAGVEALTKPDYRKLNVHAGRNDRLLHAVLCAYAKHQLDCEDIGWSKLGEILHSAICNEIGDDAYIEWGERMTGGQNAV